MIGPTIGHWVHGQGPAKAIVLHGWIGDWRVFEPMLPALDAANMSLAFMDYRGYGASRSMTGPYDIATIASDAARLADHLGWHRFSVIGHSMGGKAALRLAANLRERVNRIVAVTPVWAAAAPLPPDLVDICRRAAREVDLRELLIRHTTGGALPSAWSQALAARSAESSTTEAFASYFESWAMDDFATEVRGLTQEALVVVGERDGGVPEAGVRATWLTELPGASLAVLRDAGHYPMQECPPMLAQLIESFLCRSHS
jgi:esterase